jgi:hypothetical protein
MNKVRRDLKEQLHTEAEDIKLKKDELGERTNEPVEDDMREGWTAKIRAIIQSRVAAQVEQEVKKKLLIMVSYPYVRILAPSANPRGGHQPSKRSSGSDAANR